MSLAYVGDVFYLGVGRSRKGDVRSPPNGLEMSRPASA
jgi:hypothetical protein